jgi:hypothetical protein
VCIILNIMNLTPMWKMGGKHVSVALDMKENSRHVLYEEHSRSTLCMRNRHNESSEYSFIL